MPALSNRIVDFIVDSEQLAKRLASLLDGQSPAVAREIHDLADLVLERADSAALFDASTDLLNRACFRLFEIGQSTSGISLGEKIFRQAESVGNLNAQRRIANVIGGQYGDVADFPSAMKYLEKAVVLAKAIGDRVGEAACLSNVIAVLQEMGHYRQAISLASRVLEIDVDSDTMSSYKLQCASNGLFAAHRVGDAAMAATFLAEGQRHISSKSEALRRVFFERSRALYLIDLGKSVEAKIHLDETRSIVGLAKSSRMETLLIIASEVCDWSLGEKQTARERLQALYNETKSTRLYHHFVLQALIKVYSDASTPVEVKTAMGFARELVEYTTSVKKAKFYRQLAAKHDQSARRGAANDKTTSIDPFAVARDWLLSTAIEVPSDDGADRRELTKHEELTVIHEDIAKLRALSIRRDIRTNAVDTAENWAIAAEFFDDETGQHCYRVGYLTSLLARRLGQDATFCIRVEHAARLHDIGKIAVNELILLKPGPLDASEMAAMRLHTEVGAHILAGSDDPTLQMAKEIAHFHHEWWNGHGYPTKLAGRNIPLSARISAYADVYDALTHKRAYKTAWTHERAVDEIVRLAGTQFDPELLDPFLSILDGYRNDLIRPTFPAFADMDSNALIISRRKLLETIAVATP